MEGIKLLGLFFVLILPTITGFVVYITGYHETLDHAILHNELQNKQRFNDRAKISIFFRSSFSEELRRENFGVRVLFIWI